MQPDTLPQSSSQVAMTYDDLKEKFDGLSQRYSQNRKELQELRAAKKRERTRKKQHEPPKIMKEYGWKPWKEKPKSPSDSDTALPSQKKESYKHKKPHVEVPVREMNKKGLLRALDWEHPTATFNIGTLSANVNRALTN
ncbi:hypothetical protein BGZ51_006728 [Haplosporangium sp. Z 767]|nr:hypothetical protein BGZ51_006728 [Haplosporangium sp. Z 767]KAF9182612.1 hypothetical protein BGZ50_004804 [Haplosporangium sp. Z 11]